MSVVYDAAIRLSLVGGLAEALALVTARLAGVQTSVNAVQTGLQGWNKALIAVGATLGALAVEKGFMAIANAAKPLLDQ